MPANVGLQSKDANIVITAKGRERKNNGKGKGEERLEIWDAFVSGRAGNGKGGGPHFGPPDQRKKRGLEDEPRRAT